MSDKIIEMLNENEQARRLKQAFEDHIAKSNLSDEEVVEERKTMIMLAMTLVPETIKLMGEEVYEKINA